MARVASACPAAPPRWMLIRATFISSPSATRSCRAPLFDPALLPESLLEHVGDFLCGRLGPALNFAAATCLPVRFHPTTDDESRRVGGGNEGGHAQRRP